MKHHRPIIAILITVLAAVLAIAVIIAVHWKTLILDFAEGQLRAAFKGSAVKIAGRDVSARTLVFRGIDIITSGQPHLEIGEFRLDFTFPSIITDRTAGFFLADVVVYDKFKIAEARGLAKFSKDILALGNVRVMALNGVAEGGAMIKLGKAPSYAAALKFKDIQLEKAMEAFDLGTKIDLTGSIGGSVEFSGEGFFVTRLKGKLEASPEGGTLTIKSKEWLDKIAGYAKQDVNVIVESFKDYRYNEGRAGLGLKGTGIVMDAHMSGESGRRDLLVTLHDFNQKRR